MDRDKGTCLDCGFVVEVEFIEPDGICVGCKTLLEKSWSSIDRELDNLGY